MAESKSQKFEPINLGSIARGALVELFEKSAIKIAENIADPTTPATADREIILKIKFKPDAERRRIDVDSSAKVSLAAVSKHKSRVYTGRGTDGKTYLFDDDPRQELLFPVEPKDENMINFPRTEQATGSE